MACIDWLIVIDVQRSKQKQRTLLSASRLITGMLPAVI